MTHKEELLYLTTLVLEASKWRISEGDDTDTIRLEVQDRIRRLNGQNTTDENGYNQSEPKSVRHNRKYEDRFTRSHRRICVNGKSFYVLKDHVEKVESKNSRVGYKWIIKPDFVDLYKDKLENQQ